MSAPIHPKSIVILDFGGQYAHLIARRVREAGAFSEIRPPHTPASELKEAAGIILSGGPQSVYDTGSPQADKAIFDLGLPILGICYGHHWLAHTLGGEVKSGKTKENDALGSQDKKNDYQEALYKELAGLLKEPITPVVAPPKVMRVLLLPYKGDANELYMLRYIYFFVIVSGHIH